MIYFDHAATTPLDPRVLEVYIKTLKETYGNPSALHRLGKKANGLLREARETLARIYGADPHEVYFTSGATESNNWALISQARAYGKKGKKEILTSSLEHPAVVKTLAYLEKEGFRVIPIPPREGKICLEDFAEKITDQTGGLVCMAVNNETGDILPLEDLGNLARDRGLFFHVDGVQGMALQEIDFKEIYFTSLTCSGHKYYGPKGMGFLLTKNLATPLDSFHHGGGQEFGKRPGTVDVPGAVALAKALSLAYEEAEENQEKMEDLKSYLLESLDKASIAYEVNGLRGQKSPRICNLWLKGQQADKVLMALDLEGVCLSAGSACSAGTLQESPVLASIYPGEEDRLKESVRLSFGRENTREEIDELIESLRKICG